MINQSKPQKQLAFYLSLLGNAKSFIGVTNECPNCGGSAFIQPRLYYIARNYFDICGSGDCFISDSKHPKFVKLTPLFEQYRFYDNKKVSFRFDTYSEYELCLHWLSEIGHTHETKVCNLTVFSNISLSKWIEYLEY